jgi:hypothetical protein
LYKYRLQLTGYRNRELGWYRCVDETLRS